MKPSTTTAITTVKHQMKLREWAEQIEARQASGMSVQNWCAENGMNVKTYYYHLRKVREQCMETVPEIVPPDNAAAKQAISTLRKTDYRFHCQLIFPKKP